MQISTFIAYTSEQKEYANSVNLVDYLKSQNETLIPAGREFRWAADKSITIHDSKWYDHANREGGGPVSFLMKYYGMHYTDAMETLLDGAVHLDSGQLKQQAADNHANSIDSTEKRDFELPPKSPNMRAAFAYLLKTRKLDPEIIKHFVHEHKIYQTEYSPKCQPDKKYNNVVFVGQDETGKPCYAHTKSANSGGGYAGDWKNSDKRYCFNHEGISERLFVFEAPVDMLSYISMHQTNWQEHSYTTLGGVSDKSLTRFLENHPNVKTVTLCLDNDNTGIKNMAAHTLTLIQEGYAVDYELSLSKDWNGDLTGEPAADHKIYTGEPIKRKSADGTVSEITSSKALVFETSQDMILYMAARKHIEQTLHDNKHLSRMHGRAVQNTDEVRTLNDQPRFTWDHDVYFSFEQNLHSNALAKYLQEHPEIETVFFGVNLTESNFEPIEKYTDWLSVRGIQADFTDQLMTVPEFFQHTINLPAETITAMAGNPQSHTTERGLHP